MRVEHTAAPAIELKGLTKSFGNVVANSDVDLTVREGEILSLLGENGSGKTTLMNMLMGLYRPDKGEIYIRGERVDIQSPHDAIALGVGMIHQHFKLVDVLTVRDNIVLGTRGGSRKQVDAKIRELSQRFALHIDPDRKIYSLSVGEKQMVEIMKVLYRGARTLILDEPTGGLDPLMQREFFEIIRERSSQGTTVFLSSHILSEVQHNCSRAAIIREGRIIACDSVDTLAKTNAKRVSLRGTVDLTDLTGIRDQVTVDGITSFLFGGDINQLLRQLSDGNILDIHISEPDLEEIFLHYYEKDGDRV